MFSRPISSFSAPPGEDHLPLRGGESAEIAQVGVAAALDADARDRRGGQVGGHGERRAPVEGEGRLRHAPVAERKQIGQPPLFGFQNQIDRIGAALRHLPGGVGAPRAGFPQLLAEGVGLIPGERLRGCRALLGSDRLRLVHSSLSFRGHDVLGLLSLTFLCLQRALRQVGTDAVHRIILGKVDVIGQLFKKMRPLQAVHDRTLRLGHVESDSAVLQPMVYGLDALQSRGVDPVHRRPDEDEVAHRRVCRECLVDPGLKKSGVREIHILSSG